MSEEIEKLWEDGKNYLKDCGAEIIDISLPHTKFALPTYYIVAPAEASSNLARYYFKILAGLHVKALTSNQYERMSSLTCKCITV